jgi:solute carrier family 12 sodium/potassium/chloride transporter 2
MRLPFTRSASAPAAEGPDKGPPARGAGFGTFEGVFTPSILTILGVIMYLRFGWVVGNVGLIGALVIVTICTSITMFTALSMSAIATDRRVRAGGAYYMISRSLGVETGGAVGIPVYFAIALSVALYVVGFAESVVNIFPNLSQRWVGIVTAIAVAGLAIFSAKLAIRSQFFVMAAIAISLLSFFFGHPVEETGLDLTGAPPRQSESFWVVLAVFFPAVTGIEAGVNMSGDLRDPQRSIPRGTLAALVVGYIVYMALPIFLSLRANPETLIENPLIMREMAFWGDAILLGVWGATLSSAMGSILGAPRVLQALARDGVLPKPLRVLGKGSGEDDAPRIATIATLALALVAIWIGDLNLIAPVLTMFFLTSYMTVNVAAGIEGFLKSPSYRPMFRVHWAFPLLGALGCLVVMFLINAVATVVAAAVVIGVYTWLQRRELRAAWGDVRRGIGMALVRSVVLRADPVSDARNWRPHLLVLSGAPTKRWNLIELASSLTHGHGMITVSTVLPESARDAKRISRMEGTIREYMARRGVQGLARLISAGDPFHGAEQLVRAYGLGPLVPNTVLLGDSKEANVRDRYCAMIRRFHEARRNVVILRDEAPLSEAGATGFGRRERIDVWWGGLQANGALMMILAYLLRTSTRWLRADVCVKLVVPHEAAATSARVNLERIIGGLRVGAQAHVLIPEGRPFREILHASSADADLVFLGMAEPGDDFVEYYERMQDLATGLPTTAFVLAGEDIQFSKVLL